MENTTRLLQYLRDSSKFCTTWPVLTTFKSFSVRFKIYALGLEKAVSATKYRFISIFFIARSIKMSSFLLFVQKF